MNDELTLQLTGMAHGGAALGRHEGRVVFVPYALPGETVRVEVTDAHERYAHARLLEVLEPSPERIPPPCPYFGPHGCGGCQWQHAAYTTQLRLKTAVVTDQLSRIGRLSDPPVLPTLPDPTGWAYRNQARFHPADEGGLGFYAAATDRVVPIEMCAILHPLLVDLYDTLDMELPGLEALTLRAGTASGECMLIFEMEEDEPPAVLLDVPVSCILLLADGTAVNLVGQNHLTEAVADHSYRISAPSFFQVNTPQAAQLVRLVLEYLDLHGTEVVLDGFCGVGLFTAPLAQQAGLVIAVETDPAAVEDLLENTVGMENVEVVEGTVETALVNLEERPDAVLVDPPRTGLTVEALDGLAAIGPRRIVYVSCDPATLARDGRRLSAAGYHLARAQPVDMFPQTYHIETVSLWVRE